MNNFLKAVVVLVALGVMGGCAASQVKPEDAGLEHTAKHQTVNQNQNKEDRGCAITDATIFANAAGKAGIRDGVPATPRQEKLFAIYYEELKAECVRGKQGASLTGGRYRVTPSELAETPMEEQCLGAGTLKKNLLANEVRNVDHASAIPGSTVAYYKNVLIPDCDGWLKNRREDMEYDLRVVEVKERTKRSRYDAFHAYDKYNEPSYRHDRYYPPPVYRPERSWGKTRPLNWQARDTRFRH